MIVLGFGLASWPLGLWWPTGASKDPPGSVQKRLLCPLGAHSGPNWANLEPTWAQLEPTWSQLGASWAATWGNLEATWSQLGLKLGPSCLQKAMLGHLEAISRPLEACEAREPNIFKMLMEFYSKIDEKIAPKISIIQYYSSSKRIFAFFEQRPQTYRLLVHLEAFPKHF